MAGAIKEISLKLDARILSFYLRIYKIKRIGDPASNLREQRSGVAATDCEMGDKSIYQIDRRSRRLGEEQTND